MNYAKTKLLLFLGFSFQSAQGMYLGNTDKLPELPQQLLDRVDATRRVLDRVDATRRVLAAQSIMVARGARSALYDLLPVVHAQPINLTHDQIGSISAGLSTLADYAGPAATTAVVVEVAPVIAAGVTAVALVHLASEAYESYNEPTAREVPDATPSDAGGASSSAPSQSPSAGPSTPSYTHDRSPDDSPTREDHRYNRLDEQSRADLSQGSGAGTSSTQPSTKAPSTSKHIFCPNPITKGQLAAEEAKRAKAETDRMDREMKEQGHLSRPPQNVTAPDGMLWRDYMRHGNSAFPTRLPGPGDPRYDNANRGERSQMDAYRELQRNRLKAEEQARTDFERQAKLDQERQYRENLEQQESARIRAQEEAAQAEAQARAQAEAQERLEQQRAATHAREEAYRKKKEKFRQQDIDNGNFRDRMEEEFRAQERANSKAKDAQRAAEKEAREQKTRDEEAARDQQQRENTKRKGWFSGGFSSSDSSGSSSPSWNTPSSDDDTTSESPEAEPKSGASWGVWSKLKGLKDSVKEKITSKKKAAPASCGGGGGPPPPNRPNGEPYDNGLRNDGTEGKAEAKTKVDFAPNSITHIFVVKNGHWAEDTPERRALLLSVASDRANLVNIDPKTGVETFRKIIETGEQIWVRVYKNLITSGGYNKIPR